MPITELIGKYNDPTFHHIKSAFNQRSDDFPVLMLPVRLETKFVKYARIISPEKPSQPHVGGIIQDLYAIYHQIRTFFLPERKKQPSTRQIQSKITTFISLIQKQISQIEAIDQATRADKIVLRDAAKDLDSLAKSIDKDPRYSGKIGDLSSAIGRLTKTIEKLKTPSVSIFEKGNKYLDSLNKLNKSIDAIFVSNEINAAKLDAELDKIDLQIEELDQLADEPDFGATEEMIKEIQRKISYIKRRHKSGDVRLTNFKIGYTGIRDLKKEEYDLRKKINALKKRIDEEHVPLIRTRGQLKTYPVKQLNAEILKVMSRLMDQSRFSSLNVGSVSTIQKVLFSQLKSIHEHAQIPLEGSLTEINELKGNFLKLKNQLIDFQKKIRRVKVVTPAQKASLTKASNQITSYLNQLRELDPELVKTENQIIADDRIRLSARAANDSRINLLRARDVIRVSKASAPKKQLEVLSKQLGELQDKIKISSSNTILLPRGDYNQLKSAYFSLKDQVNNILTANPRPDASAARAEAEINLVAIENQILDQLVDINDPRDRFYERNRDRVVFRVPSSVEVMELWVRIFPDDIAIDNHDERLTEDEIKIAQDFYHEVYRLLPAGRKTAELGAWRAAAASMGVWRAAYAIKILEPQEVKLGQVEEIKNEFWDILIRELFYVPKGRGFVRNTTDSKKMVDAFAAWSSKVKIYLQPKRFTVCLENKDSLDQALAHCREAIDWAATWNRSGSRTLQESDIRAFVKQVNEVGKLIYHFYQSNLKGLNQPFKPKLTFPKVEKKSKSWDRAGFTEVLPDRFVVVTKRGDEYQHIVTGKTIPNPLPLSLDPSGNQADEFEHLEDGELKVPQSLNWMFDFEAAVEVGMGLKIPLDKIDFEEGFDLVMAYGVQNKDAQSSQELIDKLFTNHLYSEGGLEFLPLGTATNNTESVKSPYRGLDNDFDEAYQVFFNGDQAEFVNSALDQNELLISDGQFFKEGLGISEDLIRLMKHFNKKDICNGRAMNRALFSTSLEYYFKNMVDNLMGDYDISQTMLFMLRHVSGIGTIPSFKIDNQPYGVLPISPVKLFKSQGALTKGSEANYIKNLTLFLKQTKAAFEHFSTQPISINDPEYKNDPQGQFLKILGLEPLSKEFFYRFGVNAASRWKEPEDSTFVVNWDLENDVFSPTKVANNYSQLLKNLDLTTSFAQSNAISKADIYKNRFTEGNFILGPLVQDSRLGEKLAVTDKGVNYIEWLLKPETLNKITQLQFDQLPKVRIEEEERIQYTALFAMLRGALVFDRSTFAKNAVEKLVDLDVESLERLLASHIDLVSYRLDAWLTGLSNFRLGELRKENEKGTYLGAFGFVHDLRREKSPQQLITTLPKGLEPPNGGLVSKLPDSQGFVHGPSMNHAVTAAVLRAGFNAMKNQEGKANPLAINLTSSRIRKALHLLEGVSQGQELGALLGYQFERALHENYEDGVGNPLEMDKYIYRLRRKFPSYSDENIESASQVQKESIRPAHVVDGIALIDHFESYLLADKTLVESVITSNSGTIGFANYPWGLTGSLPNPSAPDVGSTAELERKKIRAIIHEIDHVMDALDALGDLMTAEGVYQLVRGNHVKAAAILDAIAEGKNIMDPDIIRSMRQGVMVSHRAILQIPVSAAVGSPWDGVPESPRGKAEPSLNHWLASRIGDPANISWLIKLDSGDFSIHLIDLGLQPIDLVLLVAAGGDESQEELQARCLDHLRGLGHSTEGKVEIRFNSPGNPADLSFGELVSLIQHLGKVIGSARSCDARDFRVAEEEANFGVEAPGIDISKLKSRINSILQDYKTMFDTLSPFQSGKTTYTETERNLAIDSLKSLSLFGFAGFYPSNPAEDVLIMAQRISSAKEKMEQNISFAEGKLSALDLEIDQAKWLTFCQDFSSKFLGSGFKILPEISLTHAAQITSQLAMPWGESPLRHLSGESDLVDWWAEISHVRKPMSQLESVSMLGELLYEDPLHLKPVQLPWDMDNLPPLSDRDYWFGAAFPDSYQPDGDRLSLLILGHQKVEEKCVGLVLDEWTELIPIAKQTTGIAFHFNQPDARAPQSLLLAVPGEKNGTWDFEELAHCVEEALSLSKLRAVEPEHVEESMYSQLLPATTTLAYGNTEHVQRLIEDEIDEDSESKMGLYVDFSRINTGYEPE
ncbi:hypothetical protein [Algoriphagus sp.]|uniref:hypothetical protein n=1 Tax=Algoriphagus sp. TaxID=1872435 RepID=UPI0026200C8E|nr:hypothetical protein [Algoriphagus sp.]